MSYEPVSGPQLVIEHTGQVFPLGAEPVTIGSREDNLLVLADPQVSPYHATIAWRPDKGAFVVEDLGSARGTYVNEVQVEGWQILRQGDVIRLGSTRMDLRLPPSAETTLGLFPPSGVDEAEESSRSLWWAGIIVAVLAGITIVCALLLGLLVLTGGRGVPDVIIQAPAKGAQVTTGSEVRLQAIASGAKDITLLELSVDGALVANNSNPAGTSSLTVSTPWTFTTPGEHEVSAQAFTASGKASSPTSVRLNVVPAEARITGTPTSTTTPTPTPTPTPEDTATPMPTALPPPQVEYFQAGSGAINAGGCTTLQWGRVSNATEVRIDPEIGAVGTPGSQEVCPLETTTYVLTATGPGGTSQASITVTVIGGLPDLRVEAITFTPNPPVTGQDNEVQITLRNAGVGAAGAFTWIWRAGSEATFDGSLNGLDAGETTVVTVIWDPQSAYAGLTTEAQVDPDNQVVESDETNNQSAAVVQVVEGVPLPQTISLRSEGSLDGYRLNDGSGSNSEDILVGNGRLVDTVGELVARGFLSFDLSGIPAGATIESVQLSFYQKEIQGDPYGKLGNLVLDHVDYGGSLDDSAYNAPALHSAVLAVQASPGAWYTLSDPTLAAWVQSTVEAGLSRFQLRLQFGQEPDDDGLEDWIAVEPGGSALGTLNAPELIVTYLP